MRPLIASFLDRVPGLQYVDAAARHCVPRDTLRSLRSFPPPRLGRGPAGASGRVGAAAQPGALRGLCGAVGAARAAGRGGGGGARGAAGRDARAAGEAAGEGGGGFLMSEASPGEGNGGGGVKRAAASKARLGRGAGWRGVAVRGLRCGRSEGRVARRRLAVRGLDERRGRAFVSEAGAEGRSGLVVRRLGWGRLTRPPTRVSGCATGCCLAGCGPARSGGGRAVGCRRAPAVRGRAVVVRWCEMSLALRRAARSGRGGGATSGGGDGGSGRGVPTAAGCGAVGAGGCARVQRRLAPGTRVPCCRHDVVRLHGCRDPAGAGQPGHAGGARRGAAAVAARLAAGHWGAQPSTGPYGPCTKRGARCRGPRGSRSCCRASRPTSPVRLPFCPTRKHWRGRRRTSQSCWTRAR
jgi:hypothetical protein